MPDRELSNLKINITIGLIVSRRVRSLADVLLLTRAIVRLLSDAQTYKTSV